MYLVSRVSSQCADSTLLSIASFADAQLTDALKTLASDPSTDIKVKKKIMSVLASWHAQFKDDPSMSLVAGLYQQCRPASRHRAEQQSLNAANLGFYDDASERRKKEERERKEKKEEEKRKAKEAKEAEKLRHKQEEEARRKRAAQPKRRPFNFEEVCLICSRMHCRNLNLNPRRSPRF